MRRLFFLDENHGSARLLSSFKYPLSNTYFFLQLISASNPINIVIVLWPVAAVRLRAKVIQSVVHHRHEIDVAILLLLLLLLISILLALFLSQLKKHAVGKECFQERRIGSP